MRTQRYWFFAWIVMISADIAPQCFADQKIMLPFYVPHPKAIIGANGTATLPAGMIPPATPNPIPGWTHPGPGYVPALGRSGLHVVIENSWAQYKGYRNITIEVHASTTTPTDRELTVELDFAHENYSGPTSTNKFTIRLPANATFVRHNQPIYSMGQNSSLRGAKFSEDGREHKELTLKNTYYYYGFPGGGAQPVRNVLSLSPKLKLNSADVVDSKNASKAAQSYINVNIGQNPSLYLISGANAGLVTSRGLPISSLESYDQLPTSPLPYNYYQSIAASIDDLQGLIKTNPLQWNAIKEWIAQGGQLIVFHNATNEKTSFEKTDRMFLLGNESDENRLERFLKKWRPLDLSDFSIRDTLINGSGISLKKANIQKHFDDQQLGVRSHGLGSVFVFGVIDGRKSSGLNLDLVALDNYTQKKFKGSSLQSVPEATTLRIPGVGNPPVTMFQIMITAFAIIIGPVNYVMLRRNKRLSWLMLTVPIGAVLVAGVLFAYSMASDGFDIRVRALSVTHLDQNEQQAVTKARIAAYAGYSVGDGMKFLPTTSVDHVEDDAYSQQYYRYRRSSGAAFVTDWVKGKDSSYKDVATQHLSSGWIGSRKMQQFNTQRAYPCKRNLKFAEQDGGLSITNRLGCAVKMVFVQDDEKTLFVAEELADGSTSPLKSIDKNEIEKRSDPLIGEITAFFGSVNSYGDPTQTPTTVSNAITKQLVNNPHPRNYVAIVEDWPDFEWGVENPLKVKPSIHFVTGEW